MGTPSFTRLTSESGIDSSPNLSPDMRSVVYVAQPSGPKSFIHLLRLDGSAPPIDLSRGAGGSDDTPVFSPDGRAIAFASSRDGSAGLFLMDADGGDVRRLINHAFDPSWTPDGRATNVVVRRARAAGRPIAIATSRSRTVPADCGRRAGSFARHSRTSRSNAAGAPGASVAIGGGSSLMIADRIETLLVPRNGRTPVASS